MIIFKAFIIHICRWPNFPVWLATLLLWARHRTDRGRRRRGTRQPRLGSHAVFSRGGGSCHYPCEFAAPHATPSSGACQRAPQCAPRRCKDHPALTAVCSGELLTLAHSILAALSIVRTLSEHDDTWAAHNLNAFSNKKGVFHRVRRFLRMPRRPSPLTVIGNLSLGPARTRERAHVEACLLYIITA